MSLDGATERDGEQEFAAIFDAYSVRIYRYLCSLLRDPALAEDLAQDTFVKAYRALRHLPPPENLNAWLYAIATNTALSVLRRRRLIAWLPLFGSAETAEQVTTQDVAAAAGERDLIQRTMALLPKSDVACLLLRFEHGLDYAEVAVALGTTVQAARMRVSRARAAFREAYLRLSQEGDDEL